jgi:hypothetical protein
MALGKGFEKRKRFSRWKVGVREDIPGRQKKQYKTVQVNAPAQ